MRVSCRSMPQKHAISAASTSTLTAVCPAAMPPLITVSSLKNRPNGGRPAAATAARPRNSAVDRQQLHHARADEPEIERVAGLVDVAGGEEQHRLGQGVIAHVQQGARKS